MKKGKDDEMHTGAEAARPVRQVRPWPDHFLWP